MATNREHINTLQVNDLILLDLVIQKTLLKELKEQVLLGQTGLL